MKKIFLYDFSDDHSTLSPATLNVKISEYYDFPLVIRKSNFQLQGYSRTDGTIVLDPGLYIIEAVKPDGEIESEIVDLKTGDAKELKLTFTPEKNIENKKELLEEESEERFEDLLMMTAPKNRSSDVDTKASATFRPFPGDAYGSLRNTKASTTFRPRQINKKFIPKKEAITVKILSFNEKGWQEERELSGAENFNRETTDSSDHIRIDIDALEYLQILEVSRNRDKPTNLLLPIQKNSMIERCTVEIVDNGVDLKLSCSFEDSKRTTLMFDYLSSNSLEEAAGLAEEAEGMLYSKMSNPIGAVIGGYILLRIGAVEQMHDWPKNLYEWFPRLSDGAIIAGELEARRGNDREAIDLFLGAYKRGLPIFREGLSLLVARLRLYMLYEKELLINETKQKEIELAYSYLAKLAMFTDDAYGLLVIDNISLIEDEYFKRSANV